MDFNRTLTAFSKLPEERSKADINQISSEIRQLKFFKAMSDVVTEEILFQCSSSLRYEFKPAHSFVMKYGERATRFYILIRGKVDILVPDLSGEKPVQKKVLEMGKGASFGELGLNDNKKRAASIYCTEDAHLAYLEREDYLGIFVNYVRNKQKSVVDVLKHNSLFSAFSYVFLIKLSYYFTEERFRRSQIVIKEGMPAHKILIVKDGEFRITKKSDNGKEIKTDKIFKIKKSKFEAAQIAIVSPGAFCNEEDLLNDKYMFTCSCESTRGIILSIKKNDLVNRILGKDAEVFFKSLKHKKGLRDQQVDVIFNIRKSLYSVPERKSEVPSTTNSSEFDKRTVENKILMSPRTVRGVKRGKIHSPGSINNSKISMSEKLLKQYQDSRKEVSKFSIEDLKSQTVSKRVYNSLFTKKIDKPANFISGYCSSTYSTLRKAYLSNF